MKLLQELLGVKKFANKTAPQIIQDLQIDGIEDTKIKFLGDGMNSTVIKIGEYAYKFWYQDSAYEKFIEYAQNNPSKFLPKIYSVKTIPAFFLRAIEAPDRIKYAKIELLNKCDFGYKFKIGKNEIELRYVYELVDVNSSSFDSFTSRVVSMLLNRRKSQFETTLISYGYNSGDFEDIVDFRITEDIVQDVAKNLDANTKEFLKVCYDIHQIIKEHKFYEDMHSGNILSRGNIPVIIDPISSGDSLEINRVISKFDKAIKDGDFSVQGKSVERKSGL